MMKHLTIARFSTLALIAFSQASFAHAPAKKTLPFQAGEELTYSLYWKGKKAGYLTSRVDSIENKNGKDIYHFEATASTTKLVSLVFPVNETVDSTWDSNGMFSQLYEEEGRAGRRSIKQSESYDFANGVCDYYRYTNDSKRGVHEVHEKRSLEKNPAQDLLSVLYYVRAIDLPKAGSAPRIPVLINAEKWELGISYLRADTVTIGNDTFNASVYHLTVYDNGSISQTAEAWISEDESRYVLRLQADVDGVGKILATLNGY